MKDVKKTLDQPVNEFEFEVSLGAGKTKHTMELAKKFLTEGFKIYWVGVETNIPRI